MQKPAWAEQPARSQNGDVKVTGPEDRWTLRAHPLYLRHASGVFADVLAGCSRPQQQETPSQDNPSDDAPAPKRHKPGLRLPLPDTTRKQALLLLHCLYQHTQPAWADDLGIPELLDLALVAHKFDCTAVLQQSDRLLVAAVEAEERLVAGCNPAQRPATAAAAWLTPQNALAQHALTDKLHLPKLALHVGAFMAMHANELDLGSVDVSILGVLQGARMLCHQLRGCC